MLSKILKLLSLPVMLMYYAVLAIYRWLVPVPRKDISGQIALITGAGSGIGQKMCVQFAKLGCKVVGVDISPAGLLTTEELLQKLGLSSRWACYKCDLSDRKNVYEISGLVKSEVGNVDILVNNAGIVTGGDFLTCKDEMIQKTMDVNCNAHFWTLKAFLPTMLEKNSGHIVTIASGAGLFGMPKLVDYCASKFAAVGLSEALLMELHLRNKTNVHVTTVCPFYIDTGMFKGVQSSIIPIIKPDDAVDSIMDAVLRNKTHVVMPSIVNFAYALKGFLPVKMLFYFGEAMDVLTSMESFKGRH